MAKGPLLIEAGALIQMCESDPAMLLVPNRDGNKRQRTDGDGEIKTGSAKLAARWRISDQENDDANPFKGRDILGQQTETHSDSRQKPIASRIAINRAPDQDHR